MYSRNNRSHSQAPRSITISLTQIEIARSEDGSRRLFRSEVNNRLTGFVEKRFRGETFLREFALGGPVNGIDEAKAKVRFNAGDSSAQPAVAPTLPDFLVSPEPMMKGKSARAKADVPTQPSKPKRAPAAKSTVVKEDRRMTRKDGLALVGGLRVRDS